MALVVLTEKLQCGLVVDSNHQSIKEAVIKLRDNPELCKQLGKKGLKASLEKYNWKKQKENLIRLYSKIA